MKNDVETRLDGSTLVVRIPMPFERRGGRKRIVAPDGSELAPASKPQPDSTLVKALAQAWRRLVDMLIPLFLICQGIPRPDRIALATEATKGKTYELGGPRACTGRLGVAPTQSPLAPPR